jgi:hypothetical protein
MASHLDTSITETVTAAEDGGWVVEVTISTAATTALPDFNATLLYQDTTNDVEYIWTETISGLVSPASPSQTVSLSLPPTVALFSADDMHVGLACINSTT